MNELDLVTESTRQRLTATLFAGQSLFSAAMIATFTLTAIIAADLSGSDATAGIPVTLSILGRAAAAYPLGILLDKAGRRLGLSAGFGMAVAGCIVAIWGIMTRSFIIFCAGATIMGMGRASTEQSRYIAAEINLPQKRARIIGFIVFAGTIGAVLGPVLVAPSETLAISIGLDGVSGPFLVGAFLYLLGLLLIFILLRPDPKMIGQAIDAAEHQAKEMIPPRPLAKIFQQPAVILAVAAMTISQLIMTLVMVITSLHMSHHNHDTGSISFVIGAHTFGMFALSAVTSLLIERYGRIPLIIAGAFILVAASLLTPVSTAVAPLALALFLLGLGWNFCFIAGSSLLTGSLVTSERSKTQGLSEMMVALAAGSAGLLTGILFDRAGIAAVSAVALAFSLVIFGFLTYYSFSKRIAEQPEPS